MRRRIHVRPMPKGDSHSSIVCAARVVPWQNYEACFEVSLTIVQVSGRLLVSQSCLTLCDPTDCSPSGFSVHRILQARILEWIAILFSRGTFQPRDRTLVSCLAGRFFAIRATICAGFVAPNSWSAIVSNEPG